MNCKHMKQSLPKSKKILLISIITILILTAIILLGTILYMKIVEREEEEKVSQRVSILWKTAEMSFIQVKEHKLSELETVEVDMPDKIKGYTVLGEIEIPKIGVKKYILEECTEESLNQTVTRFWGEGIHKAGNFSIIGHNYRGMFHDLKELNIGDTFTLTSKEGKICTYAIYETFIVEPEDVTCIEDTLKGQREVTLITCTTGGAKRLILKAKEQK